MTEHEISWGVERKQAVLEKRERREEFGSEEVEKQKAIQFHSSIEL